MEKFGISNAAPHAISDAVSLAIAAGDDSPVTICDVSPPRGADPSALADAAGLDADFLCVAYAPGQSVRLGSALSAAILIRDFGRRAAFNLATRDMNRIAVQSALLDAAALGAENVVVLRGDPVSERDSRRVSQVNDYTTTALLRDIVRMNGGRDFRGRRLTAPTTFCAGATADLSKPLEREAALVARKARAGAEFILCQSAFDADRAARFRSLVKTALDDDLSAGAGMPRLFVGAQIPSAEGGRIFGDFPKRSLAELRAGRSGLDIATENAAALWDAGFRLFYIIPPILANGARDYETANRLQEGLGTAPG